MNPSRLHRAAHLHGLAARFRGYAAQTGWPEYRSRMLAMAVELDREGAKLDGYRAFVRPVTRNIPHPLSRTG